MADLEKRAAAPAEQLPNRAVEVGQWYWIGEDDEPKRLGCVVHVGSNYFKLEGVIYHDRIHVEEFDERCTFEPDPDSYIQQTIDRHRDNVRALLDEIKALTAKLGIVRPELAESSNEASQALVVAHGVKNIKAHKAALIKAKEETLPDLFKRVEREHEKMAEWMKAKLIPMKAETQALEEKTEAIQDRIFTVELYAGLVEELVQVRKGKPAPSDAKIHLMQRRHYMDEECLVNYEAGGMEFKNIKAFDRWLCKKANLNRILPHPRCAVAFRVRRGRKKREAYYLSDFIQVWELERLDVTTFLYLRNGQQVFRLGTEINFGKQLFPDRDHSTLLGEGNLWIRTFCDDIDKIISQGEYEGILEDRKRRKAEHKKEMREYRRKLREWKKRPKKRRGPRPIEPWDTASDIERMDRWQPCTPDSVFYDDAMAKIAREAIAHNRVAVVLQGLLDRSPAFHPHPPWRLWTPEGFANGIELVYDQTRALTDGDPPDFEAYRAKLNASLKRGSMTVGQQDAWERAQAAKENERMANNWRVRDFRPHTHFTPYGDPGPGLIAEVKSLGRKQQCTFRWKRERRDYRSYWKHDDKMINTKFTCSSKALLNVDAYQPGDFKIFYSDPRTRADYLKWAPLLLAAEDYKAGKVGQ